MGIKRTEEFKIKLRKPKSKEQNRKNSDGHKGKVPWNKGLRGIYSADSLKKMSERKKQSYLGNGNPFYGKNHNEETKNKISKNKIGKKPSLEIRNKLCIAQTIRRKKDRELRNIFNVN